jgi:hypothetical protein
VSRIAHRLRVASVSFRPQRRRGAEELSFQEVLPPSPLDACEGRDDKPIFIGAGHVFSWSCCPAESEHSICSGPIRAPLWFSEPTREQCESNKNSFVSVFNTLRLQMALSNFFYCCTLRGRYHCLQRYLGHSLLLTREYPEGKKGERILVFVHFMGVTRKSDTTAGRHGQQLSAALPVW